MALPLLLATATAMVDGRGGIAAAALPGLGPALLVPRWLGRRLGGHSGDSYGACVEWVEALALLFTGVLLVQAAG